MWIETKRYLQQSLRSGVENQEEYNWQYVQPFAFYISQWMNAKEHLHMQISNAKENFRFQKIVAFDK